MMLTAEYISPIKGCGNITNRAICLIQNGDRRYINTSNHIYIEKCYFFKQGNKEVTTVITDGIAMPEGKDFR